MSVQFSSVTFSVHPLTSFTYSHSGDMA